MSNWSKNSWKSYRALDVDGMTGHAGKGNDVQNRCDVITQLLKDTGIKNLVDYGVNEYLYVKLPNDTNITSIEIDSTSKNTLGTYELVHGDYREFVPKNLMNDTVYTYHIFKDTTGEQTKLFEEILLKMHGVINSFIIVWIRDMDFTQFPIIYNLETGDKR